MRPSVAGAVALINGAAQGGRSRDHRAMLPRLLPRPRSRRAGNFTRPLLPQRVARSPRGEISAFMIEIARRHSRAGMAGAHPAPQEKRQ
jgi:hypothetical protein